MKQAFTLVELIVVITILAILGTIGFISLQGYSMQARDAKRISDISSLASKINIEQIRGVSLSNLIIPSEGTEWNAREGQILGQGNQTINTFGKVNFDNLGETASAFRDPNGRDYLAAYANSGNYNFFELATISEREGLNKIVGNYYISQPTDTASLFLTGSIDNPSEIIVYENNKRLEGNKDGNGGLIYSPSDKYIPPSQPEQPVTYSCQNSEGIILENTTTNNTENLTEDINYQNTDNTQSCYYECSIPYNGTRCDEIIEIYGDEGTEEMAICNKWVADNIGELGGGSENWIWVPARHFTTDGVGIGMGDEYYKRYVRHNNINYICNGFAVAKYEMSYSNEIAPNSTIGGTNFNTVKYEGTGVNGGVVSIPNRYPMTDITQLQAIGACQSIGTNFHLITNNEWMTIARNIELTSVNWSSGTVGNGYISTGLSSNQTLGCNGSTSKVTYTGLTRDYASKTGVGTGIGINTTCNTKRQLTLSNGEKIWDLSGNVWEQVNKANTIDGSNFDSNDIRKSNACGSIDTRHNFSGNVNGYTACNYQSGYTYSNIGPFTPSLNFNHGFGLIYSSNYDNNLFSRGGAAYSSSQGGILALSLNVTISSSQNRVQGFRCTL